MKSASLPLSFGLLFIVLTSASRADLVAEWTSFSGTLPATGGAQSGTADLNFTNSGGSISIASGSVLDITGNSAGWDSSNLDLSLLGVGLSDFELKYDVVRTVVSTKIPPSTINWSLSVNGGAFGPVATDVITSGGTSRTVTFSDASAANLQPLVLRASFVGASGGSGSKLTFDNISVSAVPEPSAFLFLMMAAGLGAGYAYVRKASH